MITRIEIDGFKTFKDFSVDLRPFVAVVGANATGKSNLFDALKFLARLANTDVRQAMQDLRGEPDELFRQTQNGPASQMKFAIEALIPKSGVDDFGKSFDTPAQRLRYEISIELKTREQGVFVVFEDCRIIKFDSDKINFKLPKKPSRSGRKTPFLETELHPEDGSPKVFRISQDGVADSGTSKRGKPLQLPAAEASRSALSTIATSEFRHLFALKKLITNMKFLEINPLEARKSNDKYEEKHLKSDASNLAAALAEIQRKTSSENRPSGALADISADLAHLIPLVKEVNVHDDIKSREYSFDLILRNNSIFSSRVISDGTIRLLALVTILNDPDRTGILCFEEPENGVHEGRIPSLVNLLRNATIESAELGEYFQIVMNTHSPAVMRSLKDEEIIFADTITSIDESNKFAEPRTRMRQLNTPKDLFDEEHDLRPSKVEEILRQQMGGI